jgi:hypothetical protein
MGRERTENKQQEKQKAKKLERGLVGFVHGL